MLTLADVHASYGRVQALRGVSLEVRAGELVCLVGANGAGKSSTLRAISGLLPPAAGSIRLDGEEIGRLSPPEILKRGIAHCPEGRRVFPYLSVEENLRMGAYIRRDAGVAADLDAVYRHFPVLRERAAQAAGTLSGGEQQMLAIGRALMARPRLILFDEPSLGLAPALVAATFGIITDIRARGTTVLMVEQNAYAALRLADRAYVMETGRITLSGAARDLIDDEHVKRAYLGG
ncbi:MAG TPA: ABC transporter ATP-binding protein [Methylomirabilota bacterium]|nr:ABC transporter ATP-binding protein [Methylomirabilota bacterium]